MKLQGLFSLKDKRKKRKMSSAANFVWRFKGEVSINLCDYKNNMSLCKFLQYVVQTKTNKDSSNTETSTL